MLCELLADLEADDEAMQLTLVPEEPLQEQQLPLVANAPLVVKEEPLMVADAAAQQQQQQPEEPLVKEAPLVANEPLAAPAAEPVAQQQQQQAEVDQSAQLVAQAPLMGRALEIVDLLAVLQKTREALVSTAAAAAAAACASKLGPLLAALPCWYVSFMLRLTWAVSGEYTPLPVTADAALEGKRGFLLPRGPLSS
jgi:hypothetical protein